MKYVLIECQQQLKPFDKIKMKSFSCGAQSSIETEACQISYYRQRDPGTTTFIFGNYFVSEWKFNSFFTFFFRKSKKLKMEKVYRLSLKEIFISVDFRHSQWSTCPCKHWSLVKSLKLYFSDKTHNWKRKYSVFVQRHEWKYSVLSLIGIYFFDWILYEEKKYYELEFFSVFGAVMSVRTKKESLSTEKKKERKSNIVFGRINAKNETNGRLNDRGDLDELHLSDKILIHSTIFNGWPKIGLGY